MNERKELITWERLLELIETGASHPDDTNWAIYRYLQQNYMTMGSVMARTLLTAYMRLHAARPLLVNSCMLGMAVKISEKYADFALPKFLDAWGYDACLRAEDRRPQVGKDGRRHLSLQQRVERAMQSYRLRHPESRPAASDDIISMYAVTIFEKVLYGKKRRFVKLVAADGTSLIADSHLFSCRPYDTCGRLYDVLIRQSAEGNKRAAEIVASAKALKDVFPTKTGYVEGIDESHGHIHIYDELSRHFVANKMSVRMGPVPSDAIKAGCFVEFCPIIATADPFKSAAIIGTVEHREGLQKFGLYDAVITYVNTKDAYIHYDITSETKPTPEGAIARSGFASIERMEEETMRGMKVGDRVRLLLYLKRGRDGVKRNHVEEVIV